MKDKETNNTFMAMEDQPQKPQYIHEQHNSQCQQFFGPVTRCIFAMPGATVTNAPVAPSTPVASHPSKPASKSKRKAEGKTEEFTPLNVTFTRKKGLMDQHFALVLNLIQKENWIMSESDPDHFLDLFSGKESDCKIVWNPEVGKGILRDLIKMMLDADLISCPSGYGYIQVIESHFIYPNGKHVRGLKGGYTSGKALNIISKCRKILMLNPKASNYSDAEEIRNLFSDERYEYQG